MPIPQSQLETWSHQGSVTQSKNTYAIVKRALEDPDAEYRDRNFKVFLQGSYCNDTNIYAESDVDVVIRYDGVFLHDVSELPAEQQSAFEASFSSGTYFYSDFKKDVEKTLKATFEDSVKGSKKAFKIEADGGRRSSDVVPAFAYRRYHEFNSVHDQNYVDGIVFFASDGTKIANYPQLHSQNCTAKHQATNSKFKPLVRIFKNMRSWLVDDGTLEAGIAPSYYIEGLLYNVPTDRFSGSYDDAIPNILNWLLETTDKTKFLCANEQYYLLHDNSPVCWPIANGSKFINAVVSLWNNW
jgi:hypothetical protein